MACGIQSTHIRMVKCRTTDLLSINPFHVFEQTGGKRKQRLCLTEGHIISEFLPSEDIRLFPVGIGLDASEQSVIGIHAAACTRSFHPQQTIPGLSPCTDPAWTILFPPVGAFGEKSSIARYFRTVFSSTDISRAMRATGYPSFLKSLILLTWDMLSTSPSPLSYFG